MNQLTFVDGTSIPQLGLGTWRLSGRKCTDVLLQAMDLGYRHIDTADFYGNHEAIGAALQQTSVVRDEIFLTTKIQAHDLEPGRIKPTVERFLRELQTEYLDLLLIHWPSQTVPVAESLRVFAELRDEGRIRNAGVSNFNRRRVREAVDAGLLPIVNNQVEYHVYLNQQRLLDFCKQMDVTVTAYSPMVHGRVGKDSLLQEIGQAHERTATQVALRWLVQKEIIAIPKAGSEQHLRENLALFDWSLSDEEMARIDAIGHEERTVNAGWEEFNED